MRTLAILTLILAGPAIARAGNFVSDPMILEDLGVFCPDDSTGRVEAPGTERGFIDLIEGDPQVDFHTDVVPGELGLGFGMRFRLADGEAPRMGRVVITHPPFGSPPVTTESYVITLESERSGMTQFDFDDPYEVQYGTWTMGIEVDGRILLEHDFEVVPEGSTPISTRMCDGPPMTS